jgi:hypothetical protein
MNTQNLDYTEIAKENQIVADAFSARDDEQQEVDAINEEMEKLNTQLKERQEALRLQLEKLAIADDKLALVATMAQDHIDKVAELKAEHEKEKTAIFLRVEKAITVTTEEWRNNELNEAAFEDLLGVAMDSLGIKTDQAGGLSEKPEEGEYKEVQEELELAS